MRNMEKVYNSLADALPNIGAIEFGEFELTSGLKSPIYVDLRRMSSHPGLLSAGAQTLWEMAIKGAGFHLIAGVPFAGTPLAVAMSLFNDIPMITPREPKEHGTKAAVEGFYLRGMRVVLIDDLITTGGSILKAIETLESAGLVVAKVCVLIDREQGGREALAKAGYDLDAAFTLQLLLVHYLGTNAITRAQYEEAMAYLDDPLSYRNNAEIWQRLEAERERQERVASYIGYDFN